MHHRSARANDKQYMSTCSRLLLLTAALTLFRFENTTDIEAVERDFGFQPMSWRVYLAEHGVD